MLSVKKWTLLTFTIFFLGNTNAASPPKSHEVTPTIERAVSLIEAKNKNEAYKLLLPLAKNGDYDALYYIGYLMTISPEINNNLQKAKKFLSLSSERGSMKAEMLLQQVVQQIQIISNEAQTPKSILGNGLPSTKEISSLRKKAETTRQEVQRKLTQIYPQQTTVHVFIKQLSHYTNQVISIEKQVNRLLPEKVRFIYYLYMRELDPTLSINDEQYKIPSLGMTPDIAGITAKKYNVAKYPSLLVETKSSITSSTPNTLLPNIHSIYQQTN